MICFFRLPITISYKAETELEVNFNIVCHVKRRTNPLTLNVKAEGFSVKMSLICEDSTGNKVNLTPKGINQIEFNDVRLFKVAFISRDEITIFNVQISFEYIKRKWVVLRLSILLVAVISICCWAFFVEEVQYTMVYCL